jgi:hypothetical protein
VSSIGQALVEEEGCSATRCCGSDYRGRAQDIGRGAWAEREKAHGASRDWLAVCMGPLAITHRVECGSSGSVEKSSRISETRQERPRRRGRTNGLTLATAHIQKFSISTNTALRQN